MEVVFLATAYYTANDVPGSDLIKGVTFTVSGSEIPNNSIINSITIDFSVIVKGLAMNKTARVILTKCIVSDGLKNLVEINGSKDSPLADITDYEPINFSYSPNLKNDTLTSNISSLTVTLTK